MYDSPTLGLHAQLQLVLAPLQQEEVVCSARKTHLLCFVLRVVRLEHTHPNLLELHHSLQEMLLLALLDCPRTNHRRAELVLRLTLSLSGRGPHLIQQSGTAGERTTVLIRPSSQTYLATPQLISKQCRIKLTHFPKMSYALIRVYTSRLTSASAKTPSAIGLRSGSLCA